MMHDEIVSWFETILPVFYMFPMSPLLDNIPCITYRMSETGPDNRRQQTINLDLWCSLKDYLWYTDRLNARVLELHRRSPTGINWADLFDALIILNDGTKGLAHRTYVFTLN
jgi:hypothetical protein